LGWRGLRQRRGLQLGRLHWRRDAGVRRRGRRQRPTGRAASKRDLCRLGRTAALSRLLTVVCVGRVAVLRVAIAEVWRAAALQASGLLLCDGLGAGEDTWETC
jgi:hypothetical protein